MNTALNRLLAAQSMVAGAATLAGLGAGDLMIACAGAALCGFSLFALSQSLHHRESTRRAVR
jgi:hypothetical protein